MFSVFFLLYQPEEAWTGAPGDSAGSDGEGRLCDSAGRWAINGAEEEEKKRPVDFPSYFHVSDCDWKWRKIKERGGRGRDENKRGRVKSATPPEGKCRGNEADDPFLSINSTLLAFILTNTSSSSSSSSSAMDSPIPSLFLLLLLLLLLFCFFFPCFAHGADGLHGRDRCRGKCSHGPPVQFPFWLEHDAAECGDPGFQLFCNDGGRPALRVPNAANQSLVVENIDYKSQSVLLRDPNGCLPRWIANLGLLGFSASASDSDSSYSSSYSYYYNYTLFKCPPPERTGLTELRCLSQPGPDRVYAVESESYVGDSPLVYCERISLDISLDLLPEPIRYIIDKALFHWKVPDCRSCRKKGSSCGLDGSNIICIPPPPGHEGRTRTEISVGVVGSLFLLAGVIGVGYVLNERRRDKAFQLKIESFLHDYKALKPTRFSYNDVKRITNDFEEKLGQGSYGTVYKGKLSSEIFVAVKMLDNSFGNGEEFINEVSTMGRIHHVNVVRMVGFCADGFRRALVYEFLPNESLEKFIFPGEDDLDASLSWVRLHDIALGVAKGIEYLHQGCDHRILHFDIKPHNVLLDDNFNPKIADFGLAKLCSKEQSAVSMTAARGTMGYIAPEVFSRNFGNVSSKSDVYSFGMLLLEMVGGRKNVDVNAKNMSQMYFPQWVYNHLNKGEELEIRIREDGDHNIARKLAIVGLWCIHWYPADRPPMKAVVQMLEGEECPVMPKNPFVSSSGSGEAATMPGRLWHTNLEVIEE